MTLCEFSRSTLAAIRDDFLNRAWPVRRPVCVLKFGPPGSGKGACAARFFREARRYGFDPLNYVDANVDTVVERLDVKGEVQRNPTAYNRFRPAANRIVDELLDRAIDSQRHIVLETTGGRLDEAWLRPLFGRLRRHRYFTLVVYPLAPTSSLLARNVARAKQIGRRVPDDEIVRGARAAAAHLYKLVAVADRVIVFDNTTLDDPCAYKILQCGEGVCWAGTQWTVDRAIRDLFGVQLQWHSPGEQKSGAVSTTPAEFQRAFHRREHFTAAVVGVAGPLVQRLEYRPPTAETPHVFVYYTRSTLTGRQEQAVETVIRNQAQRIVGSDAFVVKRGT